MTLVSPPGVVPDAAPAEVLTPTLRRTAKRVGFWAALVGFVALVGVAGVAITGTADDALLDPTSAGPTGSKALAQVLRANGVKVEVVDSLASVDAAAQGPATTGILLYDPDTVLGASKLNDLLTQTRTLVLVDPSFTTLAALAPAVAQAGPVSGTLSADCDFAPVVRAENVDGTGNGYRVIDETADVAACLGSGDDTYSLVRVTTGDTTVTVVGTTDALTNGVIGARGNAALALGLLGENRTLLWYEPGLADVAATGPQSIGDASPDWVFPTGVLALLVFLAAALWRGRRFGPLVAENLPVVVRASETMEGRARLYQRVSARQRALDALRIGAIDRIAVLCGLPRAATVDEVVAAATSVTARPLDGVRGLLLDTVPANDADLVRLSDSLLLLERDVATAVTPR